MRSRHLILILLGFLILPGASRGGDMSTVREALEKAKKQTQSITLPSVKNNQAASEAARIYYSPEYQAKLQKEIHRLKKTLFPDAAESRKPSVSKTAPGQKYLLMPDERIYVFISSSVPLDTLRNYAADLDRLRDPNISMVMRGFVDGIKHFKPTLEFLQKVLTRDPKCDFTTQQCDAFRATVNIDPLLFRRYSIGHVPAIVYVKGLSLVDAGLSEGITDNATFAEAYLVRGDVSLEYALDKIHHESHSTQVAAVLRQLRGGFYSERRTQK